MTRQPSLVASVDVAVKAHGRISTREHAWGRELIKIK
jgi:hypothetical protein